MYQYADDTALVITHEDYNTAVSILQDDIKQIMSWFSKNYIFVNNDKSNLVCFRTHQKRINLNQPIFFIHRNADNVLAYHYFTPVNLGTWYTL